MATIYMCDRCHDKFAKPGNLFKVDVPPVVENEGKSFELCRQCISHLFKSLEPLPVPKTPLYTIPLPSALTPPPWPVTCDSSTPVTVADGALPTIEPGILLEEAVKDDDIPF